MVPLQRTVPAFLSDLLSKAPLSPEKLTFAWRAAVGPAIARVSEVRLAADGTVEVDCVNEQWRREIRRSLPLIGERLRGLLGDEIVRKVKVRGARPAGPRPQPGAGEKEARKKEGS